MSVAPRARACPEFADGMVLPETAPRDFTTDRQIRLAIRKLAHTFCTDDSVLRLPFTNRRGRLHARHDDGKRPTRGTASPDAPEVGIWEADEPGAGRLTHSETMPCGYFVGLGIKNTRTEIGQTDPLLQDGAQQSQLDEL